MYNCFWRRYAESLSLYMHLRYCCNHSPINYRDLSASSHVFWNIRTRGFGDVPIALLLTVDWCYSAQCDVFTVAKRVVSLECGVLWLRVDHINALFIFIMTCWFWEWRTLLNEFELHEIVSTFFWLFHKRPCQRTLQTFADK